MSLCVVLVRPQGPINVGLVCRACANFGVTQVRVVDPQCDLHDPVVRQFAMHAHHVVDSIETFADLTSAVADRSVVVATSAHRRQGGSIVQGDPQSVQAFACAKGDAPALVFGNEADGLDNQELEVCQALVQVPTTGPHASLNLSHAAAVLLYVWCGDENAATGTVEGLESAATGAEQASLSETWLELLDGVGYFRRTDRTRFAPKLGRMLARWRISSADTHRLRGMMAQIRRALEGPNGGS